MSTSFSVGDTVRLKSGGPVMTIEKMENDRIFCVWFDSKNELQRNGFHAPTLELG
ncbi:MAG: DUF2158 domain-containing protein [Alphaproteobacteria bacterium]|nr:DUF2158 domain-containing protein [Alphaproteobacteria bacterium]